MAIARMVSGVILGAAGVVLLPGWPLAPAFAAFVRPTETEEAMVVSAHPLATEVGVEILKQGGNAVDAAIATAFAISVVEPFSAGLGGGGFALVHQSNLPQTDDFTQPELAQPDLAQPDLAQPDFAQPDIAQPSFSDSSSKSVRALDFRERAPQAASRDMYRNAAGEPDSNLSQTGHLAVGVPGTVAGLWALHQSGGSLPWTALIEPSITLAREGFEVTARLEGAIQGSAERLAKNPAAAAIFLPNQAVPQRGELLQQPDLAATLIQIAADPEAFYQGEIAEAIAQDMSENGGLVTRADLAAYQPKWREPICGPFQVAASSQADAARADSTEANTQTDLNTYEVCSMPPPSSGGVHLLQMLNMLGDVQFNGIHWAEKGWHHPDTLHFLAEVMKIAYADRAVHLGDPDFVEVPVAALTNPTYAQARVAEIDPARARAPEVVKAADAETLTRYQSLQESSDTTHLTVVDGDRNAVSMTFTINGRFGAGVVAEGTGIVLNNEMDDFAIAPGTPNLYGLVGGEANAVAAGKTPLSSMTPTLVLEQGNLRLALGAPGGSTIITTVLQAILNVLVYERDAGAAIAAPRLHHQWLPDRLMLETWGFDALTLDDLRARGHELFFRSRWGNGNLIQVKPDGMLEGAADPRGEGTADGI